MPISFRAHDLGRSSLSTELLRPARFWCATALCTLPAVLVSAQQITIGENAPETTQETEEAASRDAVTETEDRVVVRGRAISAYTVLEASTATKIPTPLLEIPQSIQVIPEQVLLDQQAVELGEVLENVSGVQASGTNRIGLVELFTVRGFQLNTTSNFYKNGRPFVFSIPPPPETLERVEFLKGPASVLYGQSEPGGIVNMSLKTPTTEPFVKGILQAGSFDFYKAHIDAGGPVGSKLGLRVNLSHQDSDSFRDFHAREQSVAAGAINWDPVHWLAVSLNGSYQKRIQQQDTGLTAGPAEPGQSSTENFGRGNRVADIPITRSLNEPWTELDIEAREAAFDIKIFFNEHWQLRNTGSWQYQENDELRADPLSVIPQDDPINGNLRGDVSRALRDRETDRRTLYFDSSLLGEFEWGVSRHKFLVGVDHFDSDLGFTEFDPDILSSQLFNIFNPVYSNAPPPTLGEELARTSRGELTQKAVYVQEQLTLFDRLHVLAGARRDTFTDSLQTTFYNPVTRLPSQEVVLLDQEQSATTYRGGVSYNPTTNFSVFVSYAESFKPNLDPFVGALIEPEEAEQWEAGLKMMLLDGFLTTTVTAFDLVKTNVVISNPVSQTLSIAGKRGAKGIEFDAIGELSAGWNLVANYAYLDAEVIEGDPRPGTTPGVGTITIEGNTPPASPEHSGKIWLTHQFQSDRLLGYRFGIGVFARSQVQGDIFNTIQHPGYARFDAMFGWAGTIGNNDVDIQLNLKNITDEEYFNGTNRNFIKPGDPFTVLGQIAVAF